MHYLSHELTMARTTEAAPSLAYRNDPAWPAAARETLTRLLGMPTAHCDDLFIIRETAKHDGFTEVIFEFQSEPGYLIPCHLLIPAGAAGPLPGMICLQGHSTGMHFSLGRKKFEGDTDEAIIPRSFALQAVSHGMCAITMDQRYMGAAGQNPKGRPACLDGYPALSALLWGRTAIGERVWDIMQLLNVIEAHLQQYIDPANVLCMGTSGGGTATVYASALEPRIRTAVVSCALCTYETSIMAMHHCPCNYIPGIRKYFEMGDVAALIAPRKLVVYSGASDNIFPLDGSKKAFETVQKAFADAGKLQNCHHLVGPGGHGFDPELVWPVIMKTQEESI